MANISTKPGVIGLCMTPFPTRFVASRADWWMSIPGIHFCSPAAREERASLQRQPGVRIYRATPDDKRRVRYCTSSLARQ